MRICLTLALFLLLVAGCTPDIPIKDAFEVTGQLPVGNIPPEFADFNNYNPQVALLLAEQLCATPYELQVEKSLDAAPGQIAVARGRCETYVPPLDRLGAAASPSPAPSAARQP